MYNAKDVYNAYSRDKVLTASPVELIVMLYDEMIKQLRIAEMAIEAKQFEKANSSLQKTVAILDELVKCLDLSVKIGQDLLDIYTFISKSVVVINSKKDKEAIAPIIELLTELRESWVHVKQNGGPMYSIEG